MGIVKWYYRTFKVLSIDKCIELGLSHHKNVYGDPINHYNCRSFWVDHKGRFYRCEGLYEYTSFQEWYFHFRNLAAHIYGVDYTICMFSSTFSDRYKIYFEKGLTPYQAIKSL